MQSKIILIFLLDKLNKPKFQLNIIRARGHLANNSAVKIGHNYAVIITAIVVYILLVIASMFSSQVIPTDLSASYRYIMIEFAASGAVVALGQILRDVEEAVQASRWAWQANCTVYV